MPRLTGHEQRILDLVSEGKSNARVANELTIQEVSVENALYHIYDKLDLAGYGDGYSPRVLAVRWNLLKL